MRTKIRLSDDPFIADDGGSVVFIIDLFHDLCALRENFLCSPRPRLLQGGRPDRLLILLGIMSLPSSSVLSSPIALTMIPRGLISDILQNNLSKRTQNRQRTRLPVQAEH